MNMNDGNERSQINDEEVQLIDRLVDGELEDDKRRELLLSLDFMSDGWRKLALAFVEAQSWQKDFRDLSQSDPQPEPVPAPAISERRSSSRWTILIAMAASFAVAFGLATLFRGDAGKSMETESVVAIPSGETEQERAEKLREPELPVPGVEELNSEDEPIDLPVVFVGENGGDPWDRISGPAMPPPVRRQLERMGHRVQSRRRVIPIALPSGQRIVVPVEQVEVELRGQGAYQ